VSTSVPSSSRPIFSASNEKGQLRIVDHPCITAIDSSYGITRVVITGLKDAPRIDEKESLFTTSSTNISIELRYSRITSDRDGYLIEL